MDIFDEIRRFQREMERLFWDFDREMRGFERQGWSDFREPIVDVWEDGDFVFVTAELPGVRKDNIDLNVTEESVEIKATVEDSEERKGMRFRSSRSFYKFVSLPKKVDPDSAEATFSNGILEVKLKKTESEKKKKVEIKEK